MRLPSLSPLLRLAPCLALAMWIVQAGAAAQSAWPSAAVVSVGIVGDIPESQRVILYNQLQAGLSERYQLAPQEALEEAEQRAFQELEFRECVIEPCLRKVREFLRIERLFFLQVAREGEFTQLTLTLIRPADKIVRAYNCQGCQIADLGEKVSALVTATSEADLAGRPRDTSSLTVRLRPPGAVLEVDGEVRGGGPKVIVDLAPGRHRLRVTHPGGNYVAQEREVEMQENEQKDIAIFLETTEAAAARSKAEDERDWWNTKWRWALGLGIAAGLIALVEGENLDESNDRQGKILGDMAAVTSWNEFLQLRAQLAKEERAAKDHKANADIATAVSALLIGAAAWVYYDPPGEPTTVAIVPTVLPGWAGMTLVVRW